MNIFSDHEWTQLFLGFMASIGVVSLISFLLGSVDGYQDGFERGIKKARAELAKEKRYKEIKREIITYQEEPPHAAD